MNAPTYQQLCHQLDRIRAIATDPSDVDRPLEGWTRVDRIRRLLDEPVWTQLAELDRTTADLRDRAAKLDRRVRKVLGDALTGATRPTQAGDDKT